MAGPRKRVKTSTPDRKANEQEVLRLAGRLLRVAGPKDVDDLVERAEMCGLVETWLLEARYIYPWRVDITRAIMEDVKKEGVNDLVATLASMPKVVHIVQDKVRSADSSIWLAVADPDRSLISAMTEHTCRGFFRTIELGNTSINLIAIQLKISC